MRKLKTTLWIMVLAIGLFQAGSVFAKSLYVNANTNLSSAPIQAYNINPDGTLTYQATHYTNFGWGTVGLTIDTDSAMLFMTQEGRGTIKLVDAVTMTDQGTVTAPSATNLAGIVVDQDKQKVYAVNRRSNFVYVYSWDAPNKTLTLDSQPPLSGTSAYGIALDEINDRLYVASRNSLIRVFDTATWTQVDSFTVPSIPVSIAVDASGGLVYTSAWGTTGINQFDLATRSGQLSPTSYGLVGLAVDPTTQNVYSTHGYSGDQLIAWDPSTMPFTQLSTTSNIGDPTGIAIPGKDISFNPLNLTKSDTPDPVLPGGILTYTLCYDNISNQQDVTNVVLVDDLPLLTSFISAQSGGSYDSVAHTVTWNEGTIVAGDGPFCYDLEVQVNAADGAILTNNATIDSDQTAVTTRTEQTNVAAAAPAVCDIDDDGDIDINDIRAITAGRGTINPLLDIDGDGRVTVLDARTCVVQCDKPRCAP